MPATDTTLTHHPVVDRATWLEARTALLDKEKALTKQRDAIASSGAAKAGP